MWNVYAKFIYNCINSEKKVSNLKLEAFENISFE